MANTSRSVLFHVIIATCFALATGVAGAQGARPVDPASAAVFEHWTPERRAAAIPRDLVVDPRGYGYLRLRDGTLVPHGHDVAAQATGGTGPRAAPIGDTTGPTISGMDPSANATIGSTYTFKATVTDASGVKSVTFKVQKSGGTVQSFSATKSANDVWSVALQGFTDGDWDWQVVAKDNAARGGNTSTTGWVAFTVGTGGGEAAALVPSPTPSGPAGARSRPPRDGCTLRCRVPSARARGPGTCAPAPSPPMGSPAGR